MENVNMAVAGIAATVYPRQNEETHGTRCTGLSSTALIAAIFGLLQAPGIGPVRIICYFLIFLAIAQQQAEVNPVIQPVME